MERGHDLRPRPARDGRIRRPRPGRSTSSSAADRGTPLIEGLNTLPSWVRYFLGSWEICPRPARLERAARSHPQGSSCSASPAPTARLARPEGSRARPVCGQRGSADRPLVRRRSPFRLVAATSAAALVATLLPALSGVAVAATPIATTTVNDPPVAPHALNAFPARDFLSADGLTPGDTVVFEVTHSDARGGATVASEPFVVDDAGLAEVNHPGGTCWDVVTPNIVAGDTVRVVVTASPNGTPHRHRRRHPRRRHHRRPAGQQRARHDHPQGHAPSDATASSTPTSPRSTHAWSPPARPSPRRASGTSGLPGTRGATFAYDEPGSTTNFGWTATWTGLTDGDVKLALGAESMGAWLGRDPAAGVESTVYETGAGIAGGPQGTCTAPKEKLPPLPGQDAVAPSTPTGLTAAVSNSNTVTLSWDAATDNEGVTNYGVYRNGTPIFTVQNADASAPAPTTFTDTNVPPGHYVYTVDAADAIDNRSPESAGADATTTAKGADTVPVVEPPTHPFMLFPSRDMIDVEGVGHGPDGAGRGHPRRQGRHQRQRSDPGRGRSRGDQPRRHQLLVGHDAGPARQRRRPRHDLQLRTAPRPRSSRCTSPTSSSARRPTPRPESSRSRVRSTATTAPACRSSRSTTGWSRRRPCRSAPPASGPSAPTPPAASRAP